MPPLTFSLHRKDTSGAPASGTWAKDTIVCATNGWFRCTVAGTPGTWVSLSGSGTGASALSDLTDVDLTGLADGDLLVWDDGAGTWVPYNPPAAPAPSPILLASVADNAEAASYFTGSHTTPQLTSNGKAFSFALPFTLLQNHFGAGKWKVTCYFQARNQVAGDNYSMSFHDYSAGATIGTDYSTTSTLTTVKLFSNSWTDASTNWPSANTIVSFAPYSTTGGSGHVFYFYGLTVYAEYDP